MPQLTEHYHKYDLYIVWNIHEVTVNIYTSIKNKSVYLNLTLLHSPNAHFGQASCPQIFFKRVFWPAQVSSDTCLSFESTHVAILYWIPPPHVTLHVPHSLYFQWTSLQGPSHGSNSLGLSKWEHRCTGNERSERLEYKRICTHRDVIVRVPGPQWLEHSDSDVICHLKVKYLFLFCSFSYTSL